MTLEDSVHAFRLRLFRRADELGNVSAACREAGLSRSLYYQLRKRFVRYGPEGLHPKRRQVSGDIENCPPDDMKVDPLRE